MLFCIQEETRKYVREIKTLDKNLCFYAYGKEQRKRTKKQR